jgi:hypothetical protein
MVEPRGEPNLSLKSSGPERGGQLAMQYLERDHPVVLEVVGEVDHRHATAAELAIQSQMVREIEVV